MKSVIADATYMGLINIMVSGNFNKIVESGLIYSSFHKTQERYFIADLI